MKSPPYWQTACAELAACDPMMADLITTFKRPLLSSKSSAFEILCRAIVGQQISVKAADSVWSRLKEKLGEITPRSVVHRRYDTLCRCGLSRGKANYLRATAQFFIDRDIRPPYWKQDFTILRQELLSIKGVGIWTFEMFAIFYLRHPDILPLSDLGLINAVSRLYNKGVTLERSDVVKIGERWTPWRTVATWYLWRSIDPSPIVY